MPVKYADVVEQAYASDLKSDGKPCGFKSRHRHHEGVTERHT